MIHVRSRKITAAMTLIACLLVAGTALVTGCGQATLRVATTQSLKNSGILNSVVPAFEKKYKVKVVATAAPTSMAALDAAKRGQADLVLVSSAMAEQEFVKQGYGVRAVPVMYNDLIVVGPQADPAQIKGLDCPGKSCKKIGTKGAVFVTGGTGTDVDKKIAMYWDKAGIDPKGQGWYVVTGQGIPQTLKVAGQKQGYMIIDRLSFLQNKSGVPLTSLVEGCAMLMNQCDAIMVSPTKLDGKTVDTENAKQFITYLTSKTGQDAIGSFKRYNMVMYHPNAEAQSSTPTKM